VIRSVFAGERNCARDMVVANAAAALVVCGRCSSPREGAEAAAEVIDNRRAATKLEQLVDWTRQHADANSG
jgi:anthranilate phosphoribosyltransferase